MSVPDISSTELFHHKLHQRVHDNPPSAHMILIIMEYIILYFNGYVHFSILFINIFYGSKKTPIHGELYSDFPQRLCTCIIPQM